jgi:hypothetical protein
MAMREYPSDMRDVLTLYAEGYSLAELLVQQGGKARYLVFLADADKHGWDAAIQSHYGYRGVDGLEKSWHEWVIAGSPNLAIARNQQLARNKARPAVIPASHKRPEPKLAQPGLIVRGQAPDEDPFVERENRTATLQQLPVVDPRSSGLQAPPPRRRDSEPSHQVPGDLPGNNPGYANIGSEETEPAEHSDSGAHWVTIPPDQIEAIIMARQGSGQQASADSTATAGEIHDLDRGPAEVPGDSSLGLPGQAELVPAVSSYDRQRSDREMPGAFPNPEATQLPRADERQLRNIQPVRRQVPRYSEFPHEPRPSPFR